MYTLGSALLYFTVVLTVFNLYKLVTEESVEERFAYFGAAAANAFLLYYIWWTLHV